MSAEPPVYGAIFVLNGHALSQNYHDRLCQARVEGRIVFASIHCIDPDPHAPLAQAHPEIHIAQTLGDFLMNYWQKPQHASSSKPASGVCTIQDLLIPDHTAPHVMLHVFLDWIKTRHSQISTTPTPIFSAPATPFFKDSPDQSVRAMSYATWMCPLECDEPSVCPHTQSTRDWDFGASLASQMQLLDARGEKTYRFFARQLVSAISCIPLDEIMTALTDWEEFLRCGKDGKVTVATHSCCHAIMGRISVRHKQ